jgi:hypothetical protein
MIKLLLLIPAILFAKPVIEFIPDSRFYGELLTENVLTKEYSSLPIIQKLQYRLEKLGFEMIQTFLDDMPNSAHGVRKAYEPGGTKETVYLVLCYNHPYFIDANKFWGIPDKKRLAVLFEPPCIIPSQYKDEIIVHYKSLLTFRDDLVDNQKFYKFFYPVLKSMRSDLPPFNQKNLACIISSNAVSKEPLELYSLRKKVIDFYEERPYCEFDFYGRGWPMNKYKNYKGSIPDKSTILKDYKFSYCFENSKNISGYITEKIFDCFEAGSIPIYLGAQNITDWIPANCFIDMRQFNSIQEVHDYIYQMPESEYECYIENIKKYLESPEAQNFSIENFCDCVINLITK